MALQIGESVPHILVNDQDGNETSFADLSGKIIVLYFYPKDSTPGCTLEGQNFRDHYATFEELGAEIIGVSRDSVRSHKNFSTKQGFPFPLWSDVDESICRAFDVIQEKKLYGRQYMGIVRSTFIIDAAGILRFEMRGIKVKGHVDKVLEAIREL